MSQILFIHSSPEFNSRITSEAGNQALTTASMLQGLQWISNPELPLDAIFLNPNDPGYSALKFLELTLIKRPATPVFLIDSEDEMNLNSAYSALKPSNIKGIFKGNETFAEFISPLRLSKNLSPSPLKRPLGRSEHAGYLAVPILDFAGLGFYPFHVFIEDEHQTLRLLGQAHAKIDADALFQAKQKTDWLYVSEQTIQEIREGLRKTQSAYMDLPHFPTAWKSAETLFNAKCLLREFQKGSASDGFIEHAHVLLSDLFSLVSQLQTETKLQNLISMAKRCDRTLHCTLLAILMAKTLKLEHHSIVEILGISSFFQDLSLFQSPYGNLSESDRETLPPQIRSYFDQHPLLSADLLSKHTTLPDVTLQVIRQHHERRDRSGYPNRVGGMQLHPMAEILSLINSYLDLGTAFGAQAESIYSHYSERASHAFMTLLNQMEAP